jgi:protein-disulfide isomerase
METFNRHKKSSLILTKIVNDRNFASTNGYNSTPTFLINGEQLSYTGQETLESKINELLDIES